MPDAKQKTYLGDGVYASGGRFGITIETQRDNGKHWIYFEAGELHALIEFAKKIGMLPGKPNAE